MKLRLGVLLLAFIGVVGSGGCKPSPDDFTFNARSGQTLGTAPTSVNLVEGDVLVLDVEPDEPDNLCVRASSGAPSIVEVLAVTGRCQRFVLLPKSPGTATVSFRARDGLEELRVDVSAAPPP